MCLPDVVHAELGFEEQFLEWFGCSYPGIAIAGCAGSRVASLGDVNIAKSLKGMDIYNDDLGKMKGVIPAVGLPPVHQSRAPHAGYSAVRPA
jgi:hypothetical protein